jgi:starch synthase
LAARVDELLSDPELAARMGKAGRERVLRHFGWPAIAARTFELYEALLGK